MTKDQQQPPRPPWKQPPTTIPTDKKGGIPPGTTIRIEKPAPKAG